MSKYRVTRDVTSRECDWLSETVTEGTILYDCYKPDYGCIGDGLAVTRDPGGDYPFFELPYDVLEVLDDPDKAARISILLDFRKKLSENR